MSNVTTGMAKAIKKVLDWVHTDEGFQKYPEHVVRLNRYCCMTRAVAEFAERHGLTGLVENIADYQRLPWTIIHDPEAARSPDAFAEDESPDAFTEDERVAFSDISAAQMASENIWMVDHHEGWGLVLAFLKPLIYPHCVPHEINFGRFNLPQGAESLPWEDSTTSLHLQVSPSTFPGEDFLVIHFAGELDEDDEDEDDGLEDSAHVMCKSMIDLALKCGKVWVPDSLFLVNTLWTDHRSGFYTREQYSSHAAEVASKYPENCEAIASSMRWMFDRLLLEAAEQPGQIPYMAYCPGDSRQVCAIGGAYNFAEGI